jgi:hypothetical protein
MGAVYCTVVNSGLADSGSSLYFLFRHSVLSATLLSVNFQVYSLISIYTHTRGHY